MDNGEKGRSITRPFPYLPPIERHRRPSFLCLNRRYHHYQRSKISSTKKITSLEEIFQFQAVGEQIFSLLQHHIEYAK